MKRFDRFLIVQFLLYSLLGLVTVVLIYDLINLIERMSYFIRYEAKVGEIIMYYVYDLPATVGLLLPVGFALGVFLVVGRLIRCNELIPLQACGVDLYRLFAAFISVTVIFGGLAFVETEFLATRSKTKFLEHKAEAIEGRTKTDPKVRNGIYFISEQGRVYYIRQLRIQDSLARDWVIWEMSEERKVHRTISIPFARHTPEGTWLGEGVEIYDFEGEQVDFQKYPKKIIPEIKESPAELGVRIKEIDEMRIGELNTYIKRRERAGSKVLEEKVEYHFRFSSPMIIIIVTLISLAAATLLRKGNITLGIGLGLLLSFLYWGLMQASRAFGYAGAVPPWLAAWFPDILFLALSGLLLIKVKR